MTQRRHSQGLVHTHEGARLLGVFGASGSEPAPFEVTITAAKVGVDEAPQSVEFAAVAVGVEDQSEVVFLWNFDDDYQFTYLPEGTEANDRQSGTAIGHKAAHVYREAGTYTVSCTAYQLTDTGIVSASGTEEVEIAATDAGITERVAISKSGSFTGAPGGATQLDWSGGEPGSFSFSPDTAYYFEAGQTFEVNFNAASFSAGGLLKMSRYGAGANPILNSSFIMWGSDHGNSTISDLEWLGPFDVDDDPDWEDTGVYPTPPPEPPATGLFIRPGGGATALLFGVQVSGYQINIYHGNTEDEAITHTVDCESTNWFDYGCFDANTGPVAYVGNYFHQKIGTQQLPAQALGSRAWNTTGVLNTARQGSIRIESSPDVVINKCNLLSYRSGWSGGYDGFAAVQAPLRVGTAEIASTETASISQNDLEGGFNVLTMAVQNTSTAQAAVGTYVAEFNFLRMDRDGQATDVIAITKPGVHIRGNVIHYPEGITHVGFDNVNLVFGNGASSFAANATSYVYGNTLVSDNDDDLSWQVVSQITDAARPIEYENNLFHLRGTSDVAGSGALFQTDYEPLQAAFPFAPESGSDAFEAYSTGRLPPLAQDGTVRTAPFSIGASEEVA